MKPDTEGNRWSTSNNGKNHSDHLKSIILNNINNNVNDTNVKIVDELKPKSVQSQLKPKVSRSLSNGSWAWVVLGCTLIASIISGGQLQCINIYYLIFLEEFKKSSSFTAWVSAAQGTALCAAGPLCSFLLPKLGARLTMIVGALAMASCYASVFFANSIPYLIVVYAFVGASECFMSGGYMAAIAMYFPKRSSFATGIMFAGSGLGAMVAGMELEWAVEAFGWRGAMLIQSAIALQICICGCLVLKPLVEDVEKPKQKNPSKVQQVVSGQPKTNPTSLKSLSLDPFFWLSVLSFMAFSAQFSTMMTIFKGFVVSAGLEASFSTVLTTSSIGNMLGKALGGPVSQLLPTPLHLAVIAVATAACTALFVLVDQPWTLAVVGGAFGLCTGHLSIVWLLTISWIYGPNEMPVVRGHIIFFGVICALSFPPIAGYTVDLYGNYNIALMMSAVACLFIGVCGLVTYILHRRKANPNTKSSYGLSGIPQMKAVPFGVQLVHYAPYVPD